MTWTHQCVQSTRSEGRDESGVGQREGRAVALQCMPSHLSSCCTQCLPSHSHVRTNGFEWVRMQATVRCAGGGTIGSYSQIIYSQIEATGGGETQAGCAAAQLDLLRIAPQFWMVEAASCTGKAMVSR